MNQMLRQIKKISTLITVLIISLLFFSTSFAQLDAKDDPALDEFKGTLQVSEASPNAPAVSVVGTKDCCSAFSSPAKINDSTNPKAGASEGKAEDKGATK
jgi:hypothetical protein